MPPGSIIDKVPNNRKLPFCQPHPTPSSLPLAKHWSVHKTFITKETTQTYGQIKHIAMMNDNSDLPMIKTNTKQYPCTSGRAEALW